MRLQEVMVDTDRERTLWYTSQANEPWSAIAFYSLLGGVRTGGHKKLRKRLGREIVIALRRKWDISMCSFRSVMSCDYFAPSIPCPGEIHPTVLSITDTPANLFQR